MTTKEDGKSYGFDSETFKHQEVQLDDPLKSARRSESSNTSNKSNKRKVKVIKSKFISKLMADDE